MNELIEVSKGTGKKIVSPIEKFPTELYHYSIFNYLPDEDLYRLSQTSPAMYAECKEPLQARARKKLLFYVVRAEEALALKMLRGNPNLLLYTSEATDYSNRTYRGYTPFQAALLCHDVTLWKKMEPYFDRLTDGQAEKAKQFNALFPEGIPQGTPYDFSVLIQTITTSSAADIDAALEKTQNDTAICNALNHFRGDFKALAMHETFFNPSHLISSLNVYNEQFYNWSLAKRDLFWRQIIGYTQRFLPAGFAQVLVQGIYSIVEDQKPLVRSLQFKYDNGSYYPLVDSSGLGFDFAIGESWGLGSPVRCARASWAPARGASAWTLLINYVELIQQNYVDLSAERSVPESPLRTTIR